MVKESTSPAVASDMDSVFSALANIARQAPVNPSSESSRSRWIGYGTKGAGWTLALMVGLSIGWTIATLSDRGTPSKPKIASETRTRPDAASYGIFTPKTAASRTADTLPLPARDAGIPKAVATPAARTLVVSASPKGEPVAAAAPAESAPSRPICRDASDRKACLDGELAGADKRMKDAYDRAVNSPLKVSDLAKMRRDWSDALAHSGQEPTASIQALDTLTTRIYNQIESASSTGTPEPAPSQKPDMK